MSSGLLILCSPLPQLHSRLAGLLAAAARHVTRTLYVQLEPRLTSHWRPPDHLLTSSPSNGPGAAQTDADYARRCARFISSFYARCHSDTRTSSLDVRFSVSGLRPGHLPRGGLTIRRDVQVVMTDLAPTLLGHDVVRQYLAWKFVTPASSTPPPNIVSIVVEQEDEAAGRGVEKEVAAGSREEWTEGATWPLHERVVLGGTFDRLHNGHKILLNEALLRCTRTLTIGICVGPMIAHKKLSELIEPFEVRQAVLRDFLTDVDDSLQYRLVPITDPFGPAIEDASLQGIVVSRETVAGGKKVNEKRTARGFNVLDLHVVDLVADPGHGAQEEEKISSSSLRMRTLGHRQQMSPPCRSSLARRPYVIGLTGGIASGKSSIASRLQTLGAFIVDCDKLAHAAYAPGSPVFQAIVSHFGQEVVAADGSIDRKVLGPKVFANKAELDVLNGMVWPAIRRMAAERIAQAAERGAEVVVLDAAVLLEAGWQEDAHEVWVAIIPQEEAVRRMKSRDGLDEVAAAQRISRQMSNAERIVSANVVFCSLWEQAYTFSQVEKAWSQLHHYLKSQDGNSKM